MLTFLGCVHASIHHFSACVLFQEIEEMVIWTWIVWNKVFSQPRAISSRRLQTQYPLETFKRYTALSSRSDRKRVWKLESLTLYITSYYLKESSHLKFWISVCIVILSCSPAILDNQCLAWCTRPQRYWNTCCIQVVDDQVESITVAWDHVVLIVFCLSFPGFVCSRLMIHSRHAVDHQLMLRQVRAIFSSVHILAWVASHLSFAVTVARFENLSRTV